MMNQRVTLCSIIMQIEGSTSILFLLLTEQVKFLISIFFSLNILHSKQLYFSLLSHNLIVQVYKHDFKEYDK